MVSKLLKHLGYKPSQFFLWSVYDYNNYDEGTVIADSLAGQGLWSWNFVYGY